MKQASKRAVLVVATAACAVLTMGCETMSGTGTDHVAEATTRARVVAELREAERLGLVTVGEESIPWFTDEQNRLIARAGDDATAGLADAKK